MTAHPDIRTRVVTRLKARLRQVGTPILEKVNARAGITAPPANVVGLRDELERLQDELDRTRRELGAELALLRAEVAGRR